MIALGNLFDQESAGVGGASKHRVDHVHKNFEVCHHLVGVVVHGPTLKGQGATCTPDPICARALPRRPSVLT